MAGEQGLTALVIEDDEYTANSLKFLLEGEGVIVDYEPYTKKGLKRLVAKKYDLVITDLNQSPSGVDVYIAATERGIKARIITGDVSGPLMNKAEEVAGKDLIMKPGIFGPILEFVDRLKAEQQK